MSSEEVKSLKERVKVLENQVKTYENHLYILQSDIQYTQKTFQLEQTKAQAQMTNLASLILDIMKDSRQYEEAKETTVLQKINNIMSSGDEYGTLNIGPTATNVSTSSTIANDTNSLINGTIPGLTSATHGQNGTAQAILPSSSRMTSNELLASAAMPQGQMLSSQGVSHQPQSSIQHQIQQSNHIAAVQQSFQQMQQQSRQQSRMVHQQRQQGQQQGQHHHQQVQKSQSQTQQHQHQHQQQQQQHQHQHQHQHHQQHQLKRPLSSGQTAKRQKATTPSSTNTDPSSILDDPLGVNSVNVNSARHGIGLSLGCGPSEPSDESRKVERKVYDKEYAFIKAPNSVEEIWNEYAIGLNGQPSIKQLELEYRTGWRRDPATSKKFNRRKIIYYAIEQGLAKGYTLDNCIRLLEDYRYLDSDKKLKQPIGWLCHGNLPPQLK